MLHKDERTALFIDGPNLYVATRCLQFEMDYRKLLDYFSSRCRLIRASYYTPLHQDQEYSPRHALAGWLDYNGFNVITPRSREYFNEGRRKVRNDIEIELVIDALEAAPHLDHIILFSGNGDYARLAISLQRSGKIVSVVSTLLANPPMVSDELRRQVNYFIELNELREHVRREFDNKKDSGSHQIYDPDEDEE